MTINEREPVGLTVFDASSTHGHLEADDLEKVRVAYRKEGIVLVRRLSFQTNTFEGVTEAITEAAALNYESGATPRARIEGKVYTSTEFPASESIDLHSELAYSTEWPLSLAFTCKVAAQTGGATPLAATARIGERLPDRLREELMAHGVTYRRNFSPLVGVDWTEVYGTRDLDEARVVATERGEVLEARGDQVTTSATLPAFIDLGDGMLRWFNQAVAFNVRTLSDEVREDLVEVMGENGVPKNSLLGDGRPFTEEEIRDMRGAAAGDALAFDWAPGDLLVIDNRKFAHGREPYSGAREIRVCMTGSGSWQEYAR